MSFQNKKIADYSQAQRFSTQILQEILQNVPRQMVPTEIIHKASLIDLKFFQDQIFNMGTSGFNKKHGKLVQIEDSRPKSLTLKVKKQPQGGIKNQNKSKPNIDQISFDRTKSFKSFYKQHRKFSLRKQATKFPIKLEKNINQRRTSKDGKEKFKEVQFLCYHTVNNLFSIFWENSSQEFQRILRIKKFQKQNDLKQRTMKSLLFQQLQEKKLKEKKEGLQKKPIQLFTTDFDGQPLPYCKKSNIICSPSNFINVNVAIINQDTHQPSKIKMQRSSKMQGNIIKSSKFQKLTFIQSTDCFGRTKLIRNLSTQDKLGIRQVNEMKSCLDQLSSDNYQPRQISFQTLNKLKSGQKQIKQQYFTKNLKKILQKKSKTIPFQARRSKQKSSLINTTKFSPQQQDNLSANHNNQKIKTTEKAQDNKHKVNINETALVHLLGQEKKIRKKITFNLSD